MLILIGGQKGGTGKSTIATNLATLRTLQKKDTFLFDIDPQSTSTLWASRRDENHIFPRIASTQKILDRRMLNSGIVIKNEIKAILPRYDDIIVDAGGADSDVMRAAITLADILILPVMPSAFDIWTLSTMNMLIDEARHTNPSLIAKVLYNKVAPQPLTAKSEIEECDNLVNDFENIQRIKTPLIFRVAIRRSQNQGLSVSEYKPLDEKADNEIKSIYQEVFNDN